MVHLWSNPLAYDIYATSLLSILQLLLHIRKITIPDYSE
jgi:hypothetical protein